jgi:glycosyltransferase involved in cell wall biosynthesis
MRPRANLIRSIKNLLRKTKPYQLAWEVNNALRRDRMRRESASTKVVSLKAHNPSGENVLLSYIIDPFLLPPNEPVSTAHTHDWESLQIARTFNELGYNVDVISFQNKEFVPEKRYSVVIDARHNLERLAPLLPPNCVKIMHIDSAHMLFHNAAEAARSLDVQRRRGVTLVPRRWEMPNLCIEYADYATVLGNEFTMSTFRYAQKPMFRVPISSHMLYAWPEEKDFMLCRNRYLWFGSGGLLHKGLDLVLEAFAEMPDRHLTVCGPIESEKDFEKAYSRELYHLPNIHTVGWVDIASREFSDILKSCLGIVYPSCSEGGGGSVINCLHGGLIPIVSREASVDVEEDYGIMLQESTITEIKNSIRQLSAMPVDRLREMAHRTWEFVRARHTRENFAKIYRETVMEILACANAASRVEKSNLLEVAPNAGRNTSPGGRSH